MNVFGGVRSVNKGPRGPRGFRGKDSSIIDFCTWLPKTIVKNLQAHDERGCFFIQNLESDLMRKGKEVQKWVSRSLPGLNLTADKASSEIEKLNDRYALTFKEARYSSEDLALLPNVPNLYGFLCITFRVMTDEEQVLLSDYQEDEEMKNMGHCEIRVSANEIILHVRHATEIIQHSCKDWTTLFIEHNTDEKVAHYRYNVNGVTGSFVGTTSDYEQDGFALGARWDDTFFLNGQIASLEMYRIPSSASLPEPVKEVIMKNQNISL